MKKNLLKFIFFFMVSLFLFNCGDSDSAFSDLFLTENNDGQTVDIGIENEIVIELESNPSTGYHWIHSNTDGSFIYQDGESIFTEDPECSGLDGCGGLETLTFRSSQTGSGVIALIYSRSLETEPSDYFTVNVNVH